jgi:hypothetical protein
MNSTSAELLSFANEWSGKLPALSDTYACAVGVRWARSTSKGIYSSSAVLV